MYISGIMFVYQLAFKPKEEERKAAFVPSLVLGPVENNFFANLRTNLFNCNSEGCFVGPMGTAKGGLQLRITENVQIALGRFNTETGTAYGAGVRFDERAMDRLAGAFSDLFKDLAPKPKQKEI